MKKWIFIFLLFVPKLVLSADVTDNINTHNYGKQFAVSNLYLAEHAGPVGADKAGYGQFWVTNAATQLPIFTGDDGVDHVLAYAGSGSGTEMFSNWGYVGGNDLPYAYETVTFAVPFASIPDIVANCLGYKDGVPSSRGDTTAGVYYSATAKNVTESNFIAVVVDVSGGNIDAGAVVMIDRTDGTRIGNMTAWAGLAAAFDGITDQSVAAGSGLTDSPTAGTVGKDWGAGNSNIVVQALVYGPNNYSMARDTGNVARNVALTLQGSTDNFSSSIVDLEVDATGTAVSQIVTFTPVSTVAYRYHRIIMASYDGNSDKFIAEVQFFYAEDPRAVVYSWMAKEPGSD